MPLPNTNIPILSIPSGGVAAPSQTVPASNSSSEAVIGQFATGGLGNASFVLSNNGVSPLASMSVWGAATINGNSVLVLSTAMGDFNAPGHRGNLGNDESLLQFASSGIDQLPGGSQGLCNIKLKGAYARIDFKASSAAGTTMQVDAVGFTMQNNTI